MEIYYIFTYLFINIQTKMQGHQNAGNKFVGIFGIYLTLYVPVQSFDII